MKSLLPFLTLVLMASACSEIKKTQPAAVKPVKVVPSYEVKFIQGGGEVDIANGEVQLEKKTIFDCFNFRKYGRYLFERQF